MKIHPSEASCIKSLRSLYPNLLFTNKPVENLFQKCFVTISYSSSVIEDSLNSRVPVILFDQWKRYMHCKSKLTEGKTIYYIGSYDDNQNFVTVYEFSGARPTGTVQDPTPSNNPANWGSPTFDWLTGDNDGVIEVGETVSVSFNDLTAISNASVPFPTPTQ